MNKRQNLYSKVLQEKISKINVKGNVAEQKIAALLNSCKQVPSKLLVETFSACILLNTDPKKTDQNIKTFVNIPNGWASKKKVAVFTSKTNTLSNPFVTVGGADLIDKIKKGEFNDYDICVSDIDMEKQANSIAKITKGRSPNKKYGTICSNPIEIAAKIANNEYKTIANTSNMVFITIGNTLMSVEQILSNLRSIIRTLQDNKPAKLKTSMISEIYISLTQCKGSVKIVPRDLVIS